MNQKQMNELFEALKAQPSDHYTFQVKRVTIDKGKTFSEDAMQELMDSIKAFIGARLMARWEGTGEPPTALSAKIDVEAR